MPPRLIVKDRLELAPGVTSTIIEVKPAAASGPRPRPRVNRAFAEQYAQRVAKAAERIPSFAKSS